ncbi:MAG: hypothetical protein RJA61_511 [Candidatus Parcubacteria bacterium]|jgi:Mg-chelatase subunit ChlD
MLSWSTRRKIIYLSIVLGTLFTIVLSIFLVWYYEPPTCFDRKENSDETGVDCGGSCALICASEALDPLVLWQRIFRVSDGVYSAVAYIQNPNATSFVSRGEYSFTVFDEKGKVLILKQGSVRILPNKKFAVFEGNLVLSAPPSRVVFEFKKPLVWQKQIAVVPEISVKNARLSRAESSPRIDAVLENKSLADIRNVEAVVIVSDENGNALGASKTFIDRIAKDSESSIVFTWPEAFEADVGLCKRPVNAILVIDRSGSMDDDKINPPQPLTDVKDSALLFVDELGVDDKVGLVSFGTTATNPPDMSLTSDFETLKGAIKNISIVLQGGQNTNIGDGILRAKEELFSTRHTEDSARVIVLLTDGIATHPQKPEDEFYPEKYAEFEAAASKRQDVDVFTIGLGNKVNTAFLQRISSGEGYAFIAPTTENLGEVYKTIANEICKKGPVVIEIIPLIESR